MEGGAVDEAGVEAGLGGACKVGSGFVTDVESGGGGDAGAPKSVVEDAGMGFGGAALAGEGDRAEIGGDAEAVEDGEEAEVEVGEDVKGPTRGEQVKRGRDIREEAPSVRGSEVEVEVVEDAVNECGVQGVACGGLEGVGDDGEPPGAVVIRRGLAVRMKRRGTSFPGVAEGVFEADGRQMEAVSRSGTGIGAADRFGELEEGACGVEEKSLKGHAGGRGGASGHHAAGIFAAFAGGVRISGLRGDVRRHFVFVLAVFAAAASDIVIAADHPGFGVAGDEEGKGDESEEPFHNGRGSLWRFEEGIVKTNP
jgi:hypothetical protein